MARFDQDTQVHERLVDATRTAREYTGSDASRAMVVMLDALAQSYLMDLVSVNPDGLVAIQAALKQVYAIRRVVDNDGVDIPKI
jgi:hypothetical protein